MRSLLSSLLLIPVLSLSGFFSLRAQDPQEIVHRVEVNMRGETSYTEMTMTTVRPRFTREISMKSWSLGDDFAMILITAPARDQGTAFLKRGKEMWNYVPGIDRTVKMPPSMMSQSWMGSDFSNDDLVRGISLVDDYFHQLLRSDSFDGHLCYVIELRPKPGVPVVYDKVIYWVAKQIYLPVKVESYDEFGNLANTINFRDIKQIGGRRIPTVVEIIPADRENHKTILTTTHANFEIRLSEVFFTIHNLTQIQ